MRRKARRSGERKAHRELMRKVGSESDDKVNETGRLINRQGDKKKENALRVRYRTR